MAIIDRGEILLEAEPLRAVDELKGRIWRRVIERRAPRGEREHAVISTKLLAGRTVVHVHSDTIPGSGFEPVEPDLEDVYFSATARHMGRRHEGPAVRSRSSGRFVVSSSLTRYAVSRPGSISRPCLYLLSW